jgi:hypothetical protein
LALPGPDLSLGYAGRSSFGVVLIGQLIIVGDDEELENQLLKRRCGTTDGRIDSKHQV